MQSSSIFAARGEYSAYAMDSVSMRGDRNSSEGGGGGGGGGGSQVSGASSGPPGMEAVTV